MRRARSERGFALLVVLSLLTVLAFLAAAAVSQARLRALTLRSEADLLAAHNLAEAALEFAKLELSRGQNAARFARDGHPHAISLDGGEGTFAIEDERGKLDINAQPAEVLAALIGASAPNAPLAPLALAQRLKAAAPRSLSDLAQTPGVSASLVEALSAFATVYSRSSRVHIETAPPQVLRSLPGLTPALLQQIAAARASGVERPSLGAAEALATAESGPEFTIVATGRTPAGVSARIVEVVVTGGENFASNRSGVRVVERR